MHDSIVELMTSCFIFFLVASEHTVVDSVFEEVLFSLSDHCGGN